MGFPGGASGKELDCQCRVNWIAGLGRSPEAGRAIHSIILAGRIPQTEKPSRLQSTGVAQSWTQLKQFSTHAFKQIQTV